MQQPKNNYLEMVNDANIDQYMALAVESHLKEEREREEKLSHYVSKGLFQQDLLIVKKYLEKNIRFSIDDKSQALNDPKLFISQICNLTKDQCEEFEADPQEYNIYFEDLQVNFLRGLGTSIMITKFDPKAK